MTELPTIQLKYEIKKLIIDTLNLPDIDPDEVPDEAELFADDNILELDSIDAIEIITAVQKKYNVRIDDQNLARFVLKSIDTIAEFVNNELEKEK